MAYTPTTWANGDTITAAGLNKMEQGIAGSVMLIHVDPETFLCDKTWQQVHDALVAGTSIYFLREVNIGEIANTYLARVINVAIDPDDPDEVLYHVSYFFTVYEDAEWRLAVQELIAMDADDYLYCV